MKFRKLLLSFFLIYFVFTKGSVFFCIIQDGYSVIQP